MEAISRFKSKIEMIPECGCWIYTGTTVTGGYGNFWINGKKRRAHRVSWETYKGPIPENKLVLHRCDTPSCVNPEHLLLGTDKDNTQDMIKKQRGCFAGEKNANSKITNKDVEAIRTDIRPQRIIAEAYGINQANVSLIKSGKSRKG